MAEFFDTVLGFFETIGIFITGFVDMTFTALDALETLVTLPIFLTGVLPSVIAVSVSLTLLLFVVKFLLGR